MVLAKDIETSLWNKAIDLMLADGWTMTYQYDGIDVGIDFSAYTLRKGDEQINFEWTNWYEGEIWCAPHQLKELEKLLGLEFRNIEAVATKLPHSPNLKPKP